MPLGVAMSPAAASLPEERVGSAAEKATASSNNGRRSSGTAESIPSGASSSPTEVVRPARRVVALAHTQVVDRQTSSLAARNQVHLGGPRRCTHLDEARDDPRRSWTTSPSRSHRDLGRESRRQRACWRTARRAEASRDRKSAAGSVHGTSHGPGVDARARCRRAAGRRSSDERSEGPSASRSVADGPDDLDQWARTGSRRASSMRLHDVRLIQAAPTRLPTACQPVQRCVVQPRLVWRAKGEPHAVRPRGTACITDPGRPHAPRTVRCVYGTRRRPLSSDENGRWQVHVQSFENRPRNVSFGLLPRVVDRTDEPPGCTVDERDHWIPRPPDLVARDTRPGRPRGRDRRPAGADQ